MLFSKQSLQKFNFSSLPRKFSMQELESKYASQRLDKAVMSKLGMPWGDAHRYIR